MKALLCLALTATPALAQVVCSQNFESAPPFDGWNVNGNQLVFPDGPNNFMGVPYLDFWGITLANDSDTRLLGDLTRYPMPLQFSVDVRVTRLDNFFGEPMNPGGFPLVLQLIDTGNPTTVADDVSIYFTGPGCPRQDQGWQTYTFSIPAPVGASMPAGWGGTGDEDPRTFEPRLPPSRTYASVLRSIDRIALTTLRPGYFYASSFWEAGFDNIRAAAAPACDPDYNQDGNVDQDDVRYLVDVIGGGENPTSRDPDFNRDGNADQDDLAALINVVAGAGCP